MAINSFYLIYMMQKVQNSYFMVNNFNTIILMPLQAVSFLVYKD